MTLSLHDIDAQIVQTGTALDVKSASIRMEETWSPFVQGTLVVAAPDRATLASLDPRQGVRVRVTGTVRYGDSKPVSALSAQWAGLKVSDLTTAYQGKTVVDVSRPLFTPWNVIRRGRPASDLSRRFAGKKVSAVTAAYRGKTAAAITADYSGTWNLFGLLTNRTRSFDLMLRARVVDYVAGTVELTLASDEAILQDVALIAAMSWTPATTSVRALVAIVLGYCGLAALVAGTADGTVDEGAQEWKPGVKAWDYVSSAVQAAGLRLWCDERRQWHLDPGTVNNAAPTLTLAVAQNLVAASDTISLDEDGWADAVVVTYTWTDAAGVQQVRVDVATAPGVLVPRKVIAVERTDVVWPGTGAAASILGRAQGRGRQPAVRAVTDLAANPGNPVLVATPDGAIQTGYASSVEFAWPDAEMNVGTRDMTLTQEGTAA